jgi:HSP20 family protein
MALVRWDPFAELDSLQNQLDNWPSVAASQHSLQLAPVTDIFTEDDKQLTVEVHLPNFTDREVDMDVHERTLTIKAEHHEKEEDKKKRHYLVRESSQSFYRSISLPKHADEDNIKAHFNDGVLKVTVPFKELPKPKKIAIGGSKKTDK